MSDARRVRVAVIGVGAAGLAMAFALSKRLGDVFDLTLFDPSFQREHRVARGFPYLADHAEPLVNAPARMMSVMPGDAEHFLRWMSRTRDPVVGRDIYVSRPTFGSYLRDSFAEVRHIWNSRAGLLHCVPEEVVELSEVSGRYTLGTSAATYFGFDHVILCVGWNTIGGNAAGDRIAAYPLTVALDRALESDHVGIIGTGLTSVDLIRALLTGGFRGHISAASRRGLLPSARNEAGSVKLALYTRRALKDRDRMSLKESLRLLRAEADVQGVDLSVPIGMMRGIQNSSQHIDYLNSSLHDDWSDLFVKLCDEIACDTWNLFDAANRRAFRQIVHPYFQAWSNPMPPTTAQLVRDAIASGQLEVRSGLMRVDARDFVFEDGTRAPMQVVVDASRSATSPIASTETPLLLSLLSNGRAMRDAFGGVRVTYGTWEVLSESGLGQNVYAVGSLTQGARYYVSALDSIVRAVSEVAETIGRRLPIGLPATAKVDTGRA